MITVYTFQGLAVGEIGSANAMTLSLNGFRKFPSCELPTVWVAFVVCVMLVESPGQNVQQNLVLAYKARELMTNKKTRRHCVSAPSKIVVVRVQVG
jgi:hypothetical protein